MRRTLVLGDLHFPFENRKALAQVYDYAKKTKPNVIIQMGDLFDMYSHSKFARSCTFINPKEELLEAHARAVKMWKTLKDISPKAECFQLMGNHDERPMKRLQEYYPEIVDFVDLKKLWEFNGVSTQNCERDELIIDDVVYMHGFRTRLGSHAEFNLYNTVVGHTHRGGVHYINLKDKIVWELNAGYLADKSTLPLSYGKQAKFSRSTLGFGEIDDYGPRFIPIEF